MLLHVFAEGDFLKYIKRFDPNLARQIKECQIDSDLIALGREVGQGNIIANN
jgi:hypothetical protein